MIINIAGIALTQLGPPKVDMVILHNCLSVALMSWPEMENLTSGKFCSVSVQLFSADCWEGLISTTLWRVAQWPYPLSRNWNYTQHARKPNINRERLWQVLKEPVWWNSLHIHVSASYLVFWQVLTWGSDHSGPGCWLPGPWTGRWCWGGDLWQ